MSSLRWHDPALIDHLRRVRAPWDTLTRRIVHAALAKFLPNPPGTLVEVGAGGGQLREWLPPQLLANIVHTEPSEPFVRAFRERHPDARVIQADATALPFESGSVGAVLALCVFDTLPSLAAVADELRRVLRPGGKVIHILDLSTSPDCLFPELIAGGELPLTNFVCDRDLRAVLTDAQKALLPPADEFDEVVAVRWDAFRTVVDFLEAAKHPLASNLGPYSGLTRPGALDSERLARDFMAVSADAVRLQTLNRALLQLTLFARQTNRPWPLRAVSTRTHIRERMAKAFTADVQPKLRPQVRRGTSAEPSGFAVEFAGPVAARDLRPRVDDTRFVLRHCGRTISRAAIPVNEFGLPVEALSGPDGFGLSVPPRTAGDGQIVNETTIEICSLSAE